MSEQLSHYLADCAARYSADRHMVGVTWDGPGYHTRVPNGAWAHPTRESLDYALALLQSGAPEHADRAAAILGAVLALQDRDPTSRTYGIWPWLGEEPLSAMAPPDWNWADFCGARLAQILRHNTALLPDKLISSMREALGHAGWSIFRRNVGASYTNIAIMGAGVALAAGEILGEPRLVDYAQSRLRRFLEHTKHHGGLSEYNSPTYTLVLIHECERILHIASDARARVAVETIRRIAWQTIAEHFHPQTGQWAGPFSRTYADHLDAGTATYLAEQTGASIRPHPALASTRRGGPTLIPPLPCPPDLSDRFTRLPAPSVEIRRRFNRRDDDTASLYGTTWMSEQACLGSVSWDSLWTQRRPLIGYWATPDDPAVALRLRFLHNGRDFASASVRCAQQGPRALALLGLFSDRGDFHLHLDRPADGRFPTEDLRVRLELSGAGVIARQIDPDLFELGAGDWHAVVHCPPSGIAGQPVRWQIAQITGGVAVDGVCAPPAGGVLDPAAATAILALGVELRHRRQISEPIAPPELTHDQQQAHARWGEHLRLSAPITAERYPWS